LLTADGLQVPSPTASLAHAAAATSNLHVGTFVTSAALRPAGLAAWEAHSLAQLSGGRFEFGIGTGHPGTVRDAGARLGMAPTTTGERLARVAQTIEQLRVLDEQAHTPVLIAAGGPNSTALAARVADIVTLAIGPTAGPDKQARRTAALRATTADAGTQPEVAFNIFVIGDEVPQWAERWVTVDAATLIANGSLAILRGSPEAMAEEIERRRAEHDISYVIVNAAFMETMAPVVAMLSGR
jgi:alkanesulfonate monooxygenase SsuD/methylene tetrahydromethanopterin reductase-like flavin-dependent oxidoreductase (luciferase family)